MPRGRRRRPRRLAMPGSSSRSVRPAPRETSGARLQRSALAPSARRIHHRAPGVRGARVRGAGEDRPSRRPPRSARPSRSRLGNLASLCAHHHREVTMHPAVAWAAALERVPLASSDAAPRRPASGSGNVRMSTSRRSARPVARAPSVSSSLASVGLDLELELVDRVAPTEIVIGTRSRSERALDPGEAKCAIEARQYRRRGSRTGNRRAAI